MATPTPSGSSKRPAGGVSTPSHLNQSSPSSAATAAPRSVPSPVATRHPSAKTPINHPTGGSSSAASKTLGGTPMMQNLSQTGSNPSPSAHALLGSGGPFTPGTLGLDSSTPAGATGLLHLPITPSLTSAAATAAAMLPTMSDLGLTASAGKRNEDDERRTRMRRVLHRLGRPAGRVSEEGIARIARRVGFAHDIEPPEKLPPEERERKVGNRPITVAGNTVLIEIDLRDHRPRHVSVTHNVQKDELAREAALAGKVLMQDLRIGSRGGLVAKLDRFARDLETLAKIDRLSSTRINCFEALAGVYASLRRLYEAEVEAAKAICKPDDPNAQATAEMAVLCKKSGHPTLHAHGEMGLRVAYWKANRFVGRKDDDEMDVDGAETDDDNTALDESDRVFSLRIETEASPAALYPSLRVSDAWLPETIDLPSADSAEGLPWQNPPPTFLAADPNGDAMAVDDDGQKLPNLRFIARLDPPVVLPYQVAVEILASVGLPAPPMLALPPQYATALLGGDVPPMQPGVFATTAVRQVLSLTKDGSERTVTHAYEMDTAKPDWSYTLDELPFSHPRQLVDVLPVLRQWVCIGTLLRQVFVVSDSSPATSKSDSLTLTNLTSSDDSVESDPVRVALTLTTSPIPTFGVTFPSDTSTTQKAAATVAVQILTNAEIAVTSSEGIKPTPQDSEKPNVQIRKTLARTLEASGDLSVWVEWLLRSVS